MKYKGSKLEERGIEVVVIPRTNENLIFKLKPVNISNFDEILPEPSKKMRINSDGSKVLIDNDKAIEEYANKKLAYMLLQSLSATEDLVFETVDIGNSDTWCNYKDEMLKSGLSELEIVKIVKGMISACGLDEDKIEIARKDFLAMKVS